MILLFLGNQTPQFRNNNFNFFKHSLEYTDDEYISLKLSWFQLEIHSLIHWAIGVANTA